MKITQLLLVLLLPSIFACAEETGDEGGNDSGTTSNVDVGSGDDDSVGADGCFDVLEGSWSLRHDEGPSQCSGYGPLECEVSQLGCSVTLQCDSFGTPLTLEIDANGVTESGDVAIGDGVVASCHAEFSEDFASDYSGYSLAVRCNAQGVTCGFAEGQYLDCEGFCDE